MDEKEVVKKVDPVQERIREFIKGKDLATLPSFQVRAELFPVVTDLQWQQAWQAVMADVPGPEASS